MRKALLSLAGALGVAALLRALRRRPAPPVEAPAEPDPADALRATIAEASEQAQAPEREPTPDQQGTLEERRRRVHERAQEAIDAMQEPPGP